MFYTFRSWAVLMCAINSLDKTGKTEALLRTIAQSQTQSQSLLP